MLEDAPALPAATETAEPAAPAAPAPEAQRPVSPLSAKTAELRADLAAGKLAGTLSEPAIAEDGILPAGEQPAAAPPAGEKPAGESAAEEVTEEQLAGEEPAAAPPVGEEPNAELVVELAPRNAGEEPLRIVVEDKATADALRMNIKNGLRRDQFFAARQELEERESELARIEDEIEVSPVHFVATRLGEQFRVDAARQLLLMPGVYEALREEFADWQYEDKRRTAATEAENVRLRGQSNWQRQVDAKGKGREQARVLSQAIDRLVPDSLADDASEMLRADLRRDAADYITNNRVASLHPGDLPRILERRLKQYGITLDDAKAALSVEGPPPVRVRTATGAPAKAAGRNAPPDAAAARETGAKLTQQVAARRAAAAVPGSGAGAPPAAPQLPKGQTIKERVKTLREKLGAS